VSASNEIHTVRYGGTYLPEGELEGAAHYRQYFSCALECNIITTIGVHHQSWLTNIVLSSFLSYVSILNYNINSEADFAEGILNATVANVLKSEFGDLSL